MQDPRIGAFKANVEKVLQHLHNEFSKLQTGRASSALVEQVSVEAYGMRQPMIAVAGISVQDAKTIVVQPWDRSVMQAVEKALQEANLGVNPVNDGVVIRLTLPSMTEERRLALTKIVHQLSEDARITIRQQRQETQDAVREEKDEDIREALKAELQREVDSANEQIEESMKKKEQEIMTV